MRGGASRWMRLSSSSGRGVAEREKANASTRPRNVLGLYFRKVLSTYTHAKVDGVDGNCIYYGLRGKSCNETRLTGVPNSCRFESSKQQLGSPTSRIRGPPTT